MKKQKNQGFFSIDFTIFPNPFIQNESILKGAF